MVESLDAAMTEAKVVDLSVPARKLTGQQRVSEQPRAVADC